MTTIEVQHTFHAVGLWIGFLLVVILLLSFQLVRQALATEDLEKRLSKLEAKDGSVR